MRQCAIGLDTARQIEAQPLELLPQANGYGRVCLSGGLCAGAIGAALLAGGFE